ncbi:MAG: biosynthetic-type acetolactate synthase large subunit [Candidatus Bathyarchaeota archaeon]
MSGAKILIESLKKENVKVIFGIPGGAILPVYDELLDSGIRHILTRHEQAAAHMADGYARASGKVGVCMATSGPGSTNLVTGIATAYMDSSPIIAITGQVAKPLIGRDAFQEIDIIGITSNIVKYNYQIRNPKEIPSIIKFAFWLASSDRKGPVLIDFPRDVQTEVTDILPSDFMEDVKLSFTKAPYEKFSEEKIKEAVNLLLKAEKPVILAGGGVIGAEACQEVLNLAETLKIPVATTLMGKGCVREDHPLALGMVGIHGTPHANYMMKEADVILAVGCRFSDRSVNIGGRIDEKAAIIHVDVDATELGKNVKTKLPILGDLKVVLTLMLKEVKNRSINNQSKVLERESYIKKLKSEIKIEAEEDKESEGYLKPPNIMKELRKILPEKSIVTTEVGQNQMWAALYFKIYHPRTFISSGGLGTMGFGFPAALGAKIAKPDVPVVDIAGDGSFLMNERELATSIEEKIPVTVIILENRVLGMVAQWQRALYSRRYSNVFLGKSPDFVKLAEAYGAVGVRVESYDELRKAVKDSLKSDVTTIIDVPISYKEDVKPIIFPQGLIRQD